MRKIFLLIFVSGLIVGFLAAHIGTLLDAGTVEAAPAPAGDLELDRSARPEIEQIVVSEFEKYASKDGLTSEGKAFVRQIASERVTQLLAQETARQLRKLRKVKAVSLNYNKSKVPSHISMSDDGRVIAVSGSEGILVSHDSGNNWEKVVKD